MPESPPLFPEGEQPHHYDEIDEGEWYYDHLAYFEIECLALIALFVLVSFIVYVATGDRFFMGAGTIASAYWCGACGAQFKHWYRSTHGPDRPT